MGIEEEAQKLDSAKVLVRLLSRCVMAESESQWRPARAIRVERKEIECEARKLIDDFGTDIVESATELLVDALWSLSENRPLITWFNYRPTNL